MKNYIKETKSFLDKAKNQVANTLGFKKPKKRESFVKIKRKTLPSKVLELSFPNSLTLVQTLVEASLVATYSQGRRAIYQGAVYVNGDHILNSSFILNSGKHTIKYGSHKEVNVLIEETQKVSIDAKIIDKPSRD